MTAERRLTPSRLALARKRYGWTLVRLSQETGISTRSLSDYENDRLEPSPQIVQRLAQELGVTEDFLRSADIEEIPVDRVSFRALSKMTAFQRDASLASARIAVLINEWIEDRFRLPVSTVPTLPGKNAEAAAEDVRGLWGLGEASIGNMVHLCEAHGVRVFSLPQACHEVDAFSFRWGKRLFVLLNTAKSGERGRFDIAHELGHLILHSEHEIPHGREAEQEANRFASAFLIPQRGVKAQRLYNANVDRIIAAKKRWNVSAMALNYRLRELGMVTEWGHRTNATNLSRMGYRRGEPGGRSRETSQLLSKVFRELRADGVGINDLARELGISADDLNETIFGLVPTVVMGGGQVASSGSRAPLRLVH